MKTEELVKRDSTGALRFWSYHLNEETGEYFTRSWKLYGARTDTKPTVPVAQNVGKANATTPAEQGLKECLAMVTKKLKEGYVRDQKDLDSVTLIKPMLAHKYGDYETTFPVLSQPKLDGIRCIATKDGLFSRKGEPIKSCKKIEATMKKLCEEYNFVFDGELYNHGLKDNFNKIQSMVSKKNPTDAELALIDADIEYHIYDYMDNVRPFYSRNKILFEEVFASNEYANHIKLVETIEHNNQESLDETYGHFLELGYEGQMIRSYNGLYHTKRSPNLLKRKEFQDAEYVITDVEEGLGNRSGMAGAIVVKLPNGATCRAGIKGGVTVNKDLLDNKDTYIGKLATIRFQNLTPDGIPRFPVFYGIREMM